jgi:hypothetical protein
MFTFDFIIIIYFYDQNNSYQLFRIKHQIRSTNATHYSEKCIDAIFVESEGADNKQAKHFQMFSLIDVKRSSLSGTIYSPGELYRIEIETTRERISDEPAVLEVFSAKPALMSGKNSQNIKYLQICKIRSVMTI